MATKPKAKPKPEAFSVEESWPEMKREKRLLSAIHPYPMNPKHHPPAQLAMLAELIRKYGPDQDIVIDGDEDYILKGHGRHKAAIIAGLKEFPCVIRFGLSDADKKAMRIQDNQVALLGGWDPELIRAEVMELKSMDFDVGLLGFGNTQLVEFTTTPLPPSQFPSVGSDIQTEHECPKCHYRWSGSSAPAKADPKAKQKRTKKK